MDKAILNLLNNKTVKQRMWLVIRRFFSWLRNKVQSSYIHNPDYYVTTCKDYSDPRDWTFQEKFWAITLDEIELSRSVDLYNWEVLDQGNTKHCVAYASASCVNENNYFFDKDYESKWDFATWFGVTEYIRNNLDSEISRQWTLMYNWPKAVKAMWYIEMYLQTLTLHDVKRALDMWVTVMTWSNRIDWRKTWIKWVVVEGNGGGHAMHLNGYDDDIELEDADWRKYRWAIKVKNTWWDDWWLNWHYRLPYEIFYLLYVGKYAMYKNQQESVNMYLAKNETPYKDVRKSDTFYKVFEWAKENNIANGYDDWTLRPKETMNTERTLAFMYNMYNKMNNKEE